MSGIVNEHVDDLLRQAEERLQREPRISSVVPVESNSSRAERKSSLTPTSGERLTVRNPQATTVLPTTQKISAGADWFHLPKTNLTPEFKRDWQLLRMRGLLDPKHQKKALRATAPEYSQVGEVIAGPTEIYSARLTKRERKTTLTGEMMSGLDAEKLRTKYAGIQRNKSSGKKAFYQKMVAQRRRRHG